MLLPVLQKQHYDGHTAYSQSKLANLMFTAELAPKVQSRGVTVNCVHPGIVATKVLHDGWGGGGSDVEVTEHIQFVTAPGLHCLVISNTLIPYCEPL